MIHDSADPGNQAQLNVLVNHRERIVLPPTAQVYVVLEDQALMDVPAVKINEARATVTQGPPYAVSVLYDPEALTGRGVYGVRAHIENDGKLMFSSTTFNPAFGKDGRTDSPVNDPVNVVVERMKGSAKVTKGPYLLGTTWTLLELAGKPAGTGAGNRAPNLMLQGVDAIVSGFAGCNRFNGRYSLRNDDVSFSQMTMTTTVCDDETELEKQYTKALANTARYRIQEGKLLLYSSDGRELARFEARNVAR
ncbi:MAG: META domain-containing protein [Deltaproteobacteria bacterium]|nr:META domain-containing protein [Deltaproteobacteria bacterium]